MSSKNDGNGNDGIQVSTAHDVESMKIPELKQELKQRGLKTTGRKNDLIERLRAAMLLENAQDDGSVCDDGDDNDDEDTASEDDESDGKNTPPPPARVLRSVLTASERASGVSASAMLTFKDVEESMRTFSGDDELSVRKWIEEFEEMSKLCGWSEVQKIVYSKRLLRGSAKLFVNFENCCKSWKQLKTALSIEFAPRVNSRQVHLELSHKKKKPTETYQEYVYKMMEIASQVNMDIQSALLYIVNGIPDTEANKAVLYGANSLKELRAKLTIYENMTSNAAAKSKNSLTGSSKKEQLNSFGDEDRRCYNCGDKGHRSRQCKDRHKGKKCFNCNDYGHVSSDCPKKIGRKTGELKSQSCRAQPQEFAVRTSVSPTIKNLKVNGVNIEALIDTGSDLNLIKSTQYLKIGAPTRIESSLTLNGIGQGRVTTIGRCEPNIELDGIVFKSPVYIVPDDAMASDVVIGRPVLNEVTLVVNSNMLRAIRLPATVSEKKMDGEQLTQEQVFLQSLSMVFAEDSFDIGDTRYTEDITTMIQNYNPQSPKETNVKMKIILNDESPVYARPRRLSLVEQNEVERQLDEWLNDAIIRPSSSDFASPIVLVKKKNGDTRICIDYRDLNRKIIKDRYPLPIVEDQIDKLSEARVFSTLDLRNGFFHVPIDEESIKYTAFVTPSGQYEFLRAPFGLCNSPAVFQRYINEVFKDLIRSNVVLTYMDDLIIPAQNEDEAISKLREVLDRAQHCGLDINWKKCQFLKRRIEYLGHTIENGEVRPSEKKIAAVVHFTTPSNLKEVQSFLGLTGYFRKFIPNYAAIARPLSNLLRDGIRFEFGDEQIEAFAQLKRILSENPVLKLYRVGAETELHTDASKFGYGAILLQRDGQDGAFHPVYYASGKTSPAEEKYTSYELEVLAIIKALKKFRVYLLGTRFKVVTDCKAFEMTMKKRDLCVRVARWALLLEEFDCVIEHRAGANMKHVDALSRNPLPIAMLVQECRDGLIARLQRAQQEDEELRPILEYPDNYKTNGYVMKHGILYKEVNGEPLLVIPKALQFDIIKSAHEQGHFAVGKTEAILKRDYWCKEMRPAIERVVKNCVSCILAERKSGKQEGLLRPIDKGDLPLDTYHVDHLGPLPSTKKRYRYVFAVVDAFTKHVWLYPTKSTTGEEAVDRLKKQSIIFGNPRRIISDRGTAFTSHCFEDYCKDQGIEYVRTTTGVPRGNGQIERVNRTLIPVLTKLTAPKPEEWHKHVDSVQQWLNATPCRSTRYSPFEILIGKRMKLKECDEIRELIERETIEIFRENRDEIRQQAHANIKRIQDENRRSFNKKRKESTKYEKGDIVAIQRTQFGAGLKLYPKFLGPYKISSVLRNDRYIVEKIGEHEGPHKTSASADHLKPWIVGEMQDEPRDVCSTSEVRCSSRMTEL